MLRAADEKGGIGVYSRNLVKELLAIDHDNEYHLFFASDQNIGKYSGYSNVFKHVVKVKNKALWDQIAIPVACIRYKIDLLFNPKFTIPLFVTCKTGMTIHGADWFIPEYAKYYRKPDILYIKLMMPLYCRKCDFILSVSELTTEDFIRVLNISGSKITTTYFGPAKFFRRISDPAELRRVREKYKLPEDFILTLSGYDRGPRKNIDKILEAYKIFCGKTPHKLVIGGKDCYKFRGDYKIPEDGWGGDIIFTGWIEQEDLPAIYSMASLYLYPSNLEAFPIPLTEAMACGTPIVTSDLNGLREIAGDSAFFVNADNPAEISGAIERIIGDSNIQRDLSAKGLERARMFNWETCAHKTLDIINRHADK